MAEVKEIYDALAATVAQSKYCREHGVPHMAPKSGRCWRCGRNIYLPANIATSIPELGIFDGRKSPGISVERAGREHIAGCPHCGWSFL